MNEREKEQLRAALGVLSGRLEPADVGGRLWEDWRPTEEETRRRAEAVVFDALCRALDAVPNRPLFPGG